MKRKYWKVLTAQRTSAIASHYQVGIEYPVGIPVTPKINNSKLMVFKRKRDAENFAIRESWHTSVKLNVHACTIKQTERKSTPFRILALSCTSMVSVPDFWEKYAFSSVNGVESIGCFNMAPNGTVFADEVTCLE